MKNLLLTLLFLAIWTTGQGQAAAGIRAGISMTNISTNQELGESEIQNQMGFNIAIMFENQFSDLLALQTESSYIGKGYSKLSPSVELIPKYDYWELAILPKLGIQKNNFRVNILGGPYLGYAISGNELAIVPVPNSTPEEYKNKIEFDQVDYNRFEVGLEGGLEFKLYNDIGSFSLQTRYFNALASTYPRDEFDAFNRGFTISLGYFYKTY